MNQETLETVSAFMDEGDLDDTFINVAPFILGSVSSLKGKDDLQQVWCMNIINHSHYSSTSLKLNRVLRI